MLFRSGPIFTDELKCATILVNGKAIGHMKGLKTPLKPEDVVSSISLAAGG